MLLVPAALIYMQPNLGTATVLVTIGISLFFVAGVPWRYFIALGGLAAAIAPIGWHFLHDYQRQRIMTFLDPEKDPLGAGYNVLQSMIAIGSGGLTGKGYLHGSQGQLDFLPEKQTDFIFTMLAEEMGFMGGAILLLAYLLIIILCYRIALSSHHRFGSYVAIGMATMLFLHLFINVGMSMGLLPVVGVPLPLFSYGGSVMIAILFGFGLVLNIWNHRAVSIERHSVSVR
jgi:rod shape determining protein RodA